MAYQLVKHEDPILRQPAKSVKKIDTKIQYLMDRMFNILRNKGIGLAAPQIGVSKRIIVLDTREYEDGLKLSLANPEIIEHSETKVKTVEGCLSCPGIQKEIERWETIVVTGLHYNGESVTVQLTGISSIAAQQEIDHINGILITDL